MELEEAIKILNDLKENVALFSTGWYPILKEGERQAIETVLNYIKEESIPRAVVEEKFKELKKVVTDYPETDEEIGEIAQLKVLQEFIEYSCDL